MLACCSADNRNSGTGDGCEAAAEAARLAADIALAALFEMKMWLHVLHMREAFPQIFLHCGQTFCPLSSFAGVAEAAGKGVAWSSVAGYPLSSDAIEALMFDALLSSARRTQLNTISNNYWLDGYLTG
jgi:hypothetical protein